MITDKDLPQEVKVDCRAIYHDIREFTARVLVAASSLMQLLSFPEPSQA